MQYSNILSKYSLAILLVMFGYVSAMIVRPGKRGSRDDIPMEASQIFFVRRSGIENKHFKSNLHNMDVTMNFGDLQGNTKERRKIKLRKFHNRDIDRRRHF